MSRHSGQSQQHYLPARVAPKAGDAIPAGGDGFAARKRHRLKRVESVVVGNEGFTAYCGTYLVGYIRWAAPKGAGAAMLRCMA